MVLCKSRICIMTAPSDCLFRCQAFSPRTLLFVELALLMGEMNYFDYISNIVSKWLCVVLLLVLCVMAIVIFSRKGIIRIQLRRLLRVMFVEYLVLLFCSTVILRDEMPRTGVRYMLFVGYLDHNMFILKDALFNIAIFIPIGFCSSVFLRFPK